MNTLVENIIQQIDELTAEERLQLEERLAERAEEEWQAEASRARSEAAARGITQSQIDQAVERLRKQPCISASNFR